MRDSFLRPAFALSTLALLALGTGVRAQVTTFNLPYIGPPSASGDTSLTFTGDGFVTASPGSFLNSFSMDNAHSSLQVNISGLAGQSIASAQLTFFIGGSDQNQPIVATSFDSGGTLGHAFDAPAALAQQTYLVSAGIENTMDVTSLLQSRINGGGQYFALHFAPVNNIFALFVQPTGPENLRLIVTPAAPGAVPEPGTLALLLVGTLTTGAGVLRRRRV